MLSECTPISICRLIFSELPSYLQNCVYVLYPIVRRNRRFTQTVNMPYILYTFRKDVGVGVGVEGRGELSWSTICDIFNAHSPLWPIVGKLIQMGENLSRVKFSSKGMLDYEHWKECMECKITLKWFNNLIRSLKGNLLDLKPCWLCFKHPMTYISVPKTQPAMMHKTLLSLSVDSLPGPDQNSP